MSIPPMFLHASALRSLWRAAWSALVLAFCMAFPAISATGAKISVVYPPPESASDYRQAYTIKLLELALGKSGVEYEIKPAANTMNQGRALSQLQAGKDIDVLWTMTSKEREKDLTAVRIPLDKGLLGWRIFLINKKNREKFAQVRTLEQLKLFLAGQGHDWPDTQILESNGLKVDVSANYDGLFKMLQADRIDYFPRSIAEIGDEEKSHPGMDLEIEQTLVVQYPTAKYFFVNKNNKALADALEVGLRAAIKDGSFEQIFQKYHGDLIRGAKLQSRTVFKLNNPLLPPETPLMQKELWFRTTP